MAQKQGLLNQITKKEFTQDYKMKIFTLWYNLGKPSPEVLYSRIISEDIKEPLSGAYPTKNTIVNWVSSDFEAKATFLDSEVSKSLEKQLIAGKIEMLQAHMKIGQKLQQLGMEYLEESGIGNARNALSAVIEGLRIERESSGAYVKFNELEKLSDEELFGELTKLVQGSEIVSIEPND